MVGLAKVELPGFHRDIRLTQDSSRRTCSHQQIATGKGAERGQYGFDECGNKVFIERDDQWLNGVRSLIHIRQKMYEQGGIFSITSRILVVDLLSSMSSFPAPGRTRTILLIPR